MVLGGVTRDGLLSVGQAGPVGVLRQRLWVQENLPEAPHSRFVIHTG